VHSKSIKITEDPESIQVIVRICQPPKLYLSTKWFVGFHSQMPLSVLPTKTRRYGKNNAQKMSSNQRAIIGLLEMNPMRERENSKYNEDRIPTDAGMQIDASEEQFQTTCISIWTRCDPGAKFTEQSEMQSLKQP
jgi:hypothetical protein